MQKKTFLFIHNGIFNHPMLAKKTKKGQSELASKCIKFSSICLYTLPLKHKN